MEKEELEDLLPAEFKDVVQLFDQKKEDDLWAK